MCGVWAKTRYGAPLEVSELVSPIRNLWHRGPDGYRWFMDSAVALVHTRLSIIDVEGGWQPFQSFDRRWIGIVNGELYDHERHRENLEAKGVTFESRSDSEVLLNLFAAGGPEAMNGISGEFAFVFYDTFARRLAFGRDLSGVKPLFMKRTEESFTLASEMKAIEEGTPDFNSNYVNAFLARSILPPDTCLLGVEHVWPGRIYTLDLETRQLTHEVYHRLPFTSHRTLQGREAVDVLEDSLRTAVRRRLRADVPVGCYLSGGVDSALIAALAVEQGSRPHAFTAAFRDKSYDESVEARSIADDLGLRHSTIELTSSNFLPSLIRSIVAFENPIANSHGAAKNLLSSLARRHVKVVLTGQGADEWFGGYAYLRAQKLESFESKHPRFAAGAGMKFRIREGARNYGHLDSTSVAFGDDPRCRVGGSMPAILGRLAKRRWYRFLTGLEIEQSARSLCLALEERMTGDGLDLRGNWNVNTWIAARTDLVHYILANVGDRQEMANSIEGRTPFLDPKVIQTACEISEGSLLRGLIEKSVVRRVAAKHLHKMHSSRRKRPFFAPIKYLYLRDNREALQHYLEIARSATPWLAWSNIRRLLDTQARSMLPVWSGQILSLKLMLFSIGVIREKLRDASFENSWQLDASAPPKRVEDLMRFQFHPFATNSEKNSRAGQVNGSSND